MTLARLRTVAAALAGAVLLAGCAETGVGVAARVGGDRILNDEVVAYVDRGLDDPAARNVDRVLLQRAWLSQLVKLRLYREAARRLDAMPSDEEYRRMVDTYVQQAGGRAAIEQDFTGRGVDARDVDEVIETVLLFELIGDALVKDVATPEPELRADYARQIEQFDQAEVAHIKLRDQRTATTVVAQLKAGASFDELAKQSLDPATAAQGGKLGVIGNGSKRFAKPIVDAVFRSRTGAIIGPVKVSDGFEIFRVIERRTLSFEDARDLLRRAKLKDQRDAKRAAYIQELSREMGISVNPRFGRWNFKETGIEQAGDSLSTTVPSPGATGAPGGGPAPGQ
ncbi:MAG TPA: peptidylprolyl isomerase [Frankiaceae bacterium]|nr:peptidylprolyl isomerase [Frankiaceae bacterium]